MSRLVSLCSAVILLVILSHGSNVHAEHHGRTFALVMTNATESDQNQIQVYDASTHSLLQTLSTLGTGGVGGNNRGVKQYKGELFAAVNNGSGTVAVYRREGDHLTFDKLVTTTSPPVSIDFGNDHMYVAGATTVDSFALQGNQVEWRDGTAALELADGFGAPPLGSTAQVQVRDGRHLLVTLKDPPERGSVDTVQLDDRGAVTGAAVTAVAAPVGSLTPFGFSVYRDGTAIITLAHTNQIGLFRDGAFTDAITLDQNAPCWTTRVGKYVFTVNTGSRTISRLIGTGSNIFVDNAVAATVTTGAPTDADTAGGILGVIDHAAGQSHLTLFTYNVFGELTVSGSAINLGVANPNGVAIMSPPDVDEH
ncbi:MAG TPA: hypothetical protein VGY48_28330 [Vicinamibacterales bacterium]|jgi:hypothetical protein|nr:hypothetical protein [Vicinamibacterales bacterium]